MTEVQTLVYGMLGSVVLLGLQQVFWMRNVQKLVDKSMSRSYAEYVQVDNLKALPKNKTNNSETARINDDYATEQAQRANRAFGLS